LKEAGLPAAGANLEQVAPPRIYVVAATDVVAATSDVESVYRSAFKGDHRPALSISLVNALPREAKVEVEILAAALP
jgi:enamine deaminase RidA (YjgF/YER057c/UK114 family)